MKVTKTSFDDLLILEPEVFGDERGYFMESYNYRTFSGVGLDIEFIQDNESRSKKGVLRGLHFQNAPHVQTKLIRVLSGSVLDFALDLRKDKSTFGKIFTIELTAENKKQLLVPHGFAHGFLVTSEIADILYKTDEYYNKPSEGGINLLDPVLNIPGLSLQGQYVLSDKDRALPNLQEAKFNF